MDRDELVGARRARRPRPMDARERNVAGGIAFGLLLTSLALTFVLPERHGYDPLVGAALVLMFALASRIEFEVGPMSAVPVQLLFVPMLFLAPLPVVPLLV